MSLSHHFGTWNLKKAVAARAKQTHVSSIGFRLFFSSKLQPATTTYPSQVSPLHAPGSASPRQFCSLFPYHLKKLHYYCCFRGTKLGIYRR
eukprot:scaffold20384_cov56-Skeletonema_menzelii.AAC.1